VVTRRRFRQVDVFTTTAYHGNPVAVVLDGDGLTTRQAQQLANWTNLSETTIVLRPTTPAAHYRVRIFTPTGELPFAGHPTLGTCHAWLSAAADAANSGTGTVTAANTDTVTAAKAVTVTVADDVIVQECAAGLIRIRRTDDGLAFAAPPLLRSGPVEESMLRAIAAGCDIDRADIIDAAWVDNGPGWVAVLLPTVEAVLAVRPGYLGFDLGLVGLYPPGSAEHCEVRAFFPKAGVTAEDPVTGSLQASLAQWLLSTGRLTAPYVASQGTVLGRTGRAHISQDSTGAIWVAGGTVTCVEGEIAI
jgi:PhzF family phenazine biosynthesis protein